MEYTHRHTKIIFTIGPSTEPDDILEKLLIQRVDICRINMAHASHEWTLEIISKIRRVCEKTGHHIPIMMDVKGPEIRTGSVESPYELLEDEIIDFYTSSDAKPAEGIRGVSVNYPGLIHDIEEGNTILIDNGLIHTKVLEKHSDRIRCQVLIPGLLASKRHINLPGVKVNLPALTEKDLKDIEVGASQGIAFFALSFVREGQDIRQMREELKRLNSSAKIIAKIEDHSGIKNIDEIIRESDGIMIARGDLGIECPYQDIPIIQKDFVSKSIAMGKPAIVATHMLESMINAPVPTRAEVSDVFTAVVEQADAIMLSGETTTGKYPLKCVEVMKKIAHKVEKATPHSHNTSLHLESHKDKMLRSAVVLAQELENTGIIVFTKTGGSARKISALRPSKCPLYAMTDDLLVSKQLRLLWGIEPFYLEFQNDRNKTIDNAMELLKKKKLIQAGDYIIILTSILVDDTSVDTIQLRKVH